MAVTDNDLRKLWREAGGEFHGPNIETGAMPEAKLLPFLRGLARTALAQPEAVEAVPLVWRDGAPPKPWAGEWFIARTTFNDRVVLTALPEEYSYDFKTADDTYIKADRIKQWMQFPDSQFIAPPLAPDERMRRALDYIVSQQWSENADLDDICTIAKKALSRADEGKESEGGVEGHASEETATVAASGKRESRPRDLEAAGSQREAEAGWPGESPRVKEQASNRESRDSDRIGGPAAARSRAGIKPGPSDPTPPDDTAQREEIARNIEMAWAIEPTPFNRADVAARVAIYFLHTRAGG